MHLKKAKPRPCRPHTNGLVERLNRRIAEALGRQPKRGIGHRTFAGQADREAFRSGFGADYNRTAADLPDQTRKRG